ncbi:MAG: M1 family metallopeptidase [Chitinophagaceae bacterium]
MQKPVIIFYLLTFFYTCTFAQQTGSRLQELDILHYQFSLQLADTSDLIKGEAKITVRFLKSLTFFRLDLTGRTSTGQGMTVKNVLEKGRSVTIEHSGDDLLMHAMVNKGDTSEYTIFYEGVPADGLIISKNKYGQRTIFSDNWPNRAHHWLPCVDHPADKARVDFIVIAPDHYQVISNGVKVEETSLENSQKSSHWRESADLSTKIMAIGVADFAVNYAGEVDCIPVSSWIYPQDRDKGFFDYALALDVLPWFIKKVGPYPFQKLANIQSKTMFGGMENAGAIFYSENSVKGDRTMESLLAHEIAHQWFGNSATESDWPHLWLSEGFATYMTHWYLEDKYGKDSLVQRLKDDRVKIIAYSKLKSTPVVNTSITSDYMQLLNVNAYQKGGWVLYMMRNLLGSAVFEQGIRNYYSAFKGKNASTADFQHVMERISGKDLNQFFRQWLFTPGQPDLHIGWKYDASKKTVLIIITQNQATAYQFPMDIKLVYGKQDLIRSLRVKEKSASVTIPVTGKPFNLIPDPDTKLLFTAVVEEIKE